MLEFPLSAIAAFSATGTVHRAFNHLIASTPESILAVPIALASGDLRRVVDGCPLPWHEVWAVIDTPVEPNWSIVGAAELRRDQPRLALVAEADWLRDRIPLAADPDQLLTRLSHVTGIRFAHL